ncbi:MAG: diguanylate cyclase [Nitrospinaceae bacterium]
MESLRNLLIKQVDRFKGDDPGLLRAVDRLVEAEGDSVYPALLHVFTQLDFKPEEAKQIWRELLTHQQEMDASMGRPVMLMTALCDYFTSVRKSIKTPKVVELATFEEAHQNSRSDAMTGLYNRNYFLEALSGEISRSKRNNLEFSLLFLDLDNFKSINDTIGHLAGDLVLTRISAMVLKEKRAEDTAARYGGEELILLLPGTNKANALVTGERIRKKVEENIFNYQNTTFRVTLSGGIASYPMDARRGMELIDCADKALYNAKAAGKNRIDLYSTDKRHSGRVDFGGQVKLQQLGSLSIIRQLTGRSRDLSPTGLLFETDQQLDLGARVQLELPIPEPGEPIVVLGTVVRVENLEKNFEVGISFLEMDSKEKELITRHFRNTLNPDPFEP